MKTNNTTGNDGPRYIIPILIAILLWGMHLLALLFPEGRLWGFNHLQFLPSVYTYIYIIAGLLSLMLLVPPFRDGIGRLYNSLSNSLTNRRSTTGWLILSVLFLVVFWVMRMPANFLSESYGSMKNVGTNLPVQYRWLEGGASVVVSLFSHLIPAGQLSRGEYAYAILSVLSGAITVYFFFLLAWELTDEKRKRLFIFGLLIFSGWTLLFFGYLENSPIIWPLITAYLYFSIRYLNGHGNLVMPTIMLAVSLIINLQVLFFLISYPVLVFSHGRWNELYRKYRAIIWSATAVALVTAVYFFINHYLHSLVFQLHFLPLIFSRPGSPGYAVFSLIHVEDILNLVTLLIPIWPILLILGIRKWRDAFTDPIDRYLLSFVAGGALFLIIIDPSLGMGRDWDYLALSCLGPMLLLSRWALNADKPVYRLFPGLALLSLVLVFPYWATNLKYSPHMDYVLWNLRLDQSRSKTGLVLLKGYYGSIKDYKMADSLNLALYKHFPALPLIDRAQDYIFNHEPQEAMKVAEQILEVDPYSFEGYLMRGASRLYTGNLAGAVSDLETTVDLAPYHSVAWSHLGQAYEAEKRHEDAIRSFRRSQELDPHLVMTEEGMAVTFNSLNMFDSAFTYATRVLEKDSTKMQICLIAGISAVRMGDNVNGAIYLHRYIDMDPPAFGRNKAMELLQRLR